MTRRTFSPFNLIFAGLVASIIALVGPLVGAEVRVCLDPHAPVTLSSYVPLPSRPDVTAALLPRLPDGTPVPWGTPNAKLIIACGGMSNAAQWCPKFGNRLKQLVGNVAGKGKAIYVVPVAAYGVTTREWADPADPHWGDVVDKIEHVGTLAQVVIWMQTHTVTYWADSGTMTAGQVQAVMANAKALAPNVALFLNLDLNGTGWAWDLLQNGQPSPGYVSVDGFIYVDGEITKHPSMQEIARNGVILKWLAETQTGVPAGSTAEYFKVATNGPYTEDGQTANLHLVCNNIDVKDGVHLTPKQFAPDAGDALVGGNIAERLYAWPVFREALTW